MARTTNGRSGGSAPIFPSSEELERAIRRNYEARTNPAVPKRTGPTRPMDISVDEMTSATSLMDTSQVISPLAGMGGMSAADAANARDFSGDDGGWDDFYSYGDTGYRNKNYADTTIYQVNGQSQFGESVTSVRQARSKGAGSRDPAPITVIPTSTTNPDRPRTIAAGYDADRQVLTIVFRDGTYYNYYTVDVNTWEKFKAYYSKGKEIIPKVLDAFPRGTANMTGSTSTSREQLYRISRTAQWIGGGLPKSQFDRSAPRINPTKQRKRK